MLVFSLHRNEKSYLSNKLGEQQECTRLCEHDVMISNNTNLTVRWRKKTDILSGLRILFLKRGTWKLPGVRYMNIFFHPIK